MRISAVERRRFSNTSQPREFQLFQPIWGAARPLRTAFAAGKNRVERRGGLENILRERDVVRVVV
jgi:hypothetical protein